MAKYQVNKDKCLGCFICTVNCPAGMAQDDDAKAKVVDSDAVEIKHPKHLSLLT